MNRPRLLSLSSCIWRFLFVGDICIGDGGGVGVVDVVVVVVDVDVTVVLLLLSKLGGQFSYMSRGLCSWPGASVVRFSLPSLCLSVH